jgi:TonB family protein
MRSFTTFVSMTLVLAVAACGSSRSTPPMLPVHEIDKNAPPEPSRASPAFGNFVRTREPQLQFCYQDTRAASPSLAGSATVAVTLTPDGNVLAADVIRRSWSGKGSEIVENCMLSRVRSWKFPTSENEFEKQTVSFAVIFSR